MRFSALKLCGVVAMATIIAQPANALQCGHWLEFYNQKVTLEELPRKAYEAYGPQQKGDVAYFGKFSLPNNTKLPHDVIYSAEEYGVYSIISDALGAFNYDQEQFGDAYATLSFNYKGLLIFEGIIYVDGKAQSIKTDRTYISLVQHELPGRLPKLNVEMFGMFRTLSLEGEEDTYFEVSDRFCPDHTGLDEEHLMLGLGRKLENGEFVFLDPKEFVGRLKQCVAKQGDC